MRRFPWLALLALLVAAGAGADSAVERVFARIDDGTLSGEEAAWHLAAAVVEPSLLPADLTAGADAAKCGTPAVVEALRLVEDSSTPVAGEVEMLLARPVLSGPEYTFDTAGGHFKIHWTNSGGDATTLEYAQAVGTYADYSWQVEIDQMGYYDPPSDLGLGGDSKYDIYIEQQSSLGYTSPDGIPDPTTPYNDTSSYIAIAPGLGVGLCQVTVAHEFQHACQFACDQAEPTWFMENCSTWIEDEVYPDVNDYWNYLHGGDNPLRRPWWDIREGGGSLYWYAGCIWARYMEYRIDVDAVLEVWQNCAAVWGNNMLSAQQNMFSAHGMTWEQGFMEYALWRWFTAANWYAGCGLYDSEAAQWTPGPYIFSYHNITTLPASGDEGIYPPDTYGIHWIKVALANYQNGWVNMHFDGRDNFDWDLGVIMWDQGLDWQYQWYDCSTAGVKDVSVSTTGWDYVIFVPALLTDTSLDKYYTFDITYSTGVEGGEPGAQPASILLPANPAGPGSSVSFTVPFDTQARLDVFDICGRLVSVLYDAEAQAGEHEVALAGLPSTGTYFLRLSAAGQVCGSRLTYME